MSLAKIIVPDDVLDVQICDNCHKYLSAKPVKVGKGKILCGRCVDKENDKYVKSYYGIFAEFALFKCINHYDGCSKLLSYEQVIDHEKDCRSENYECFLCSEKSLEVPIYMLSYHMKTKHRKSFLKKNVFTVDLIHLKLNVFFYRVDNYLFFIKEQFNSNNKSVWLHIIGVGKKFQDLNLNLKYFIKLQDGSIIQFESNTWQDSLDAYSNNSRYNVLINSAKEHQLLTVHFEIEIPRYTQYVQIGSYSPEINEKEDLTFVSKTNQFNIKEDNLNLRKIGKNIKIPETSHKLVHIEENELLDSNLNEGQLNAKEDSESLSKLIQKELSLIDQTGQKKCMWSRLLKFKSNNEIKNDHVFISTCKTKLVIKQFVNRKVETISICFHCILCKCILKNISDNFVLNYGHLRHLVCNCCLLYVSQFYEVIPLNLLISNKVFLSIQYSCLKRWEIYGSPTDNVILYNHYDSTLFAEKPCCMENCQFIASTASSLIVHFESRHHESLIFLAENYLSESFYLLYPPKQPFKRVYILQYDVFIKVLFLYRSSDKTYSLNAEICDKNKENINLIMHVLKKCDEKWKHIGTFFNEKMRMKAQMDELVVRFIVL